MPHTSPAPNSHATRASGCPFTSFAERVADRPARIGALLFGAGAYAVFFFTFVYGAGFVGNWIVPKSIDSGAPAALVPALLINTALLLLFVVQHTVMARPAFKRWWTTIVPPSLERSAFVLAASLSLLLLFLLWQPLPETVWRVEQPIAAGALVALALFGWGLVLFSSFVINHFDLFGLRQAWFRFRNQPPTPVGFQLRGPYRLVRHPLMVGFLIAFWATPHMSVGHLFFAIMTTGYVFMGIWFEERDLVAAHGDDYLAYRRRVRGLIPIPRATPRRAAPSLARPAGRGAARPMTLEPYVP